MLFQRNVLLLLVHKWNPAGGERLQCSGACTVTLTSPGKKQSDHVKFKRVSVRRPLLSNHQELKQGQSLVKSCHLYREAMCTF